MPFFFIVNLYVASEWEKVNGFCFCQLSDTAALPWGSCPCIFGTVKESSDTDAVPLDYNFGLKANQSETPAASVPRLLLHGGSSRHISASHLALGHE